MYRFEHDGIKSKVPLGTTLDLQKPFCLSKETATVAGTSISRDTHCTPASNSTASLWFIPESSCKWIVPTDSTSIKPPNKTTFNHGPHQSSIAPIPNVFLPMSTQSSQDLRPQLRAEMSGQEMIESSVSLRCIQFPSHYHVRPTIFLPRMLHYPSEARFGPA